MTTPTKQAQRTPISDESEIKRCLVINQRAYQIPKDVADAHDALTARVAELEAECRNLVEAKRFDRSVFDDDTAFVDWAQSRVRAILAKGKA